MLNDDAVSTLTELGCRAVSVVPPGVDAEDLQVGQPEKLGPGPWVVYAGNPDRYQDLDVLISAMRQLPEVGLVMVSASSLGEWADCGLPRLKLVQTADFERVKSVMAAADIAAIPRTVCSGYPIKLLNSLGMGIPTVVAAGSAQPLPGVVQVPNRDPTAMAEAIRLALRDPDRLSNLGASARAHVLASCTWEARARDLEDIYQRVLSGRSDQSL